MTETSASAKRRRDESDRCHYCDCRLTHNIPPRLATDATIEHLHSRVAFPDGRPNVKNAIVIACRKCNGDRNDAEVRALDIEQRRALAGRWPLTDREATR